MARSSAKTETPRQAPCSLEFYEASIELLVLEVLSYGRPLVGLAPLADGELLTPERIDAEADAAERFVATRVVRTWVGYLSLALDEEEWSVFAESHQSPFRYPGPPGEATARYGRAGAAAAVVVNETRADPDSDELTGHRVINTGGGDRQTRAGARVGQVARN